MKGNPFKFTMLILLAGAFIFLIFRPFAYAIAIAAAVTIGITALVYLGQYIGSIYRKFRIRNTIEGIIEEKVDLLEKQIRIHQADLSTIEVEMADIDVQLAEGSLSSTATHKLIRLRDEFLGEKELKKEKLTFYKEIADKYHQLLSDQEVLKKISSKKAKLKEVRNEKPSEEEEPLQLISDKAIIEEMDYLTLRMDNVVHIDEARDIQKELIILYD